MIQDILEVFKLAGKPNLGSFSRVPTADANLWKPNELLPYGVLSIGASNWTWPISKPSALHDLDGSVLARKNRYISTSVFIKSPEVNNLGPQSHISFSTEGCWNGMKFKIFVLGYIIEIDWNSAFWLTFRSFSKDKFKCCR